eukprot:CAMPEP_0114248664 /NCGR_PEP_ID=MMETSP0058-20121206/13701_1 /TAXON_ID=36894 /ORGANISM="Pyramimonas parkeae, CCMP726" /LENGTH=512 /DNA_ID=CAMNT_0001362101 /DNA_START=284 /DNA_END=1823 /DNA_ORIENTATION=-
MERTRPLNAFVTEVLNLHPAAIRSDARRLSGQTLGPLDGIPVAVKDNFCTEGVTTTAGSRTLLRYSPQYDATLVARLHAEGAVLVGKTNMDEFGMGSFNMHSAVGPCVSPWAARAAASASTPSATSSSASNVAVHHLPNARVPGGSSGGSAVAVATGCALGALGSDTGGSVRLPAAYTGVVGFKPSYGRLSRWGLVAYTSSLDTPGLMTNSVADARLLYTLLEGHDPLDATSLKGSAKSPSRWNRTPGGLALQGLRVGIPQEYAVEEMSEATREAWEVGAARLRDVGADIVPVSLETTAAALAAYYVIAPAEASSNLARFDGVRYGLRRFANGDETAGASERDAEVASSLHAALAASRSAGFGEEVQRRLLVGTYALSGEVVGRFFMQAQRVRRAVVQDFQRAFGHVDVLLAPASPGVAPLCIEAREMLATEAYAADVMTVPASLAGLPALVVPVVRSAAENLPLGLQLIAPRMAESMLLEVGQALEHVAAEHTHSGTYTVSISHDHMSSLL